MAIIKVTNLRTQAILGIKQAERIHQQDLIVNFSLEIDASQCSQQDDIKHTVDYEELTQSVMRLIQESHCMLVERLVNDILDLLMAYPRVCRAWVKVDKPNALPHVDSVSVEEIRDRN
jgi:D-erythro-7,8-dihydroneopterin triphosphate epimerase